jgi:hypothetical protein
MMLRLFTEHQSKREGGGGTRLRKVLGSPWRFSGGGDTSRTIFRICCEGETDGDIVAQ